MNVSLRQLRALVALALIAAVLALALLLGTSPIVFKTPAGVADTGGDGVSVRLNPGRSIAALE